MLPAIETFRRPAQGVAIGWAGVDEPAFAVPFPGQTLIGAFAAGPDAVVFVGSRLDMKGTSVGSTLFARFDRDRGCIVARMEVPHLRAESASASRDGRHAFAWGLGGILVVEVASLRLVRRIELYRFTAQGGWTTSWDEFDGQGPEMHAWDDGGRRQRAADAGWEGTGIQFGFQVTEAPDGTLVHVERWARPVGSPDGCKQQDLKIADWRLGTAQRRIFRSGSTPTSLDRIDAGADLLYVTRRQVGLFWASPPEDTSRAGPYACADPAEHALVLHQWPLLDPEAVPRTTAVRTATAEVWAAAVAARPRGRAFPGDPDDWAKALALPSPAAEVGARAFWIAAARCLLPEVYEDPRDGVVWLSFQDGRIRSLDQAGRLGPLIAFGGEPNVPSDLHYSHNAAPKLSFQGEDRIVVCIDGQRWPIKMARYVFRASDFAGRTEPVTLQPARPGPLPGSHAKAFAAFVRDRRRDRFALPDWSQDSVAAALDAQRAAIAAGLPDLVDPEEDKLTFSYKVAGKPVKEAAFFRRIAKDALPVVHELRALLTAYTDALGEGVQPWQDPDEGVGGLGPALHALALLDPDCLDVLRAYLETRDGEHEGYALDVVVPAFFERHGWRDAAAVRFGIYATLNRYWGGSQPAEGFDGMGDAMARLLTPGEAVEAVLRSAEHFGRKGDFGYDAAAYRAAFRSLLDDADPYEAEVRDGLREPDPDT